MWKPRQFPAGPSSAARVFSETRHPPGDGPGGAGQGDVEVAERRRTAPRPPPDFKVILLNDDFTPMDFVVDLLVTVFGKSADEAVRIMLQVHRQGKGVCGVYTKQIAEAKVELVGALARAEGHPLMCVMEEV